MHLLRSNVSPAKFLLEDSPCEGILSRRLTTGLFSSSIFDEGGDCGKGWVMEQKPWGAQIESKPMLCWSLQKYDSIMRRISFISGVFSFWGLVQTLLLIYKDADSMGCFTKCLIAWFNRWYYSTISSSLWEMNFIIKTLTECWEYEWCCGNLQLLT